MSCCIELEVRRRWDSGNFVDVGVEIPTHDYKQFPSQPYEGYMLAYVIEEIGEGKPALLVVEFPPHAKEAGQMHKHPVSDRVITGMQGSGDFIYVREGVTHRMQVEPGMQIWMPRGVVHNFEAGLQGLVVESLHTVWVPTTHPDCYEAVKEAGDETRS